MKMGLFLSVNFVIVIWYFRGGGEGGMRTVWAKMVWWVMDLLQLFAEVIGCLLGTEVLNPGTRFRGWRDAAVGVGGGGAAALNIHPSS